MKIRTSNLQTSEQLEFYKSISHGQAAMVILVFDTPFWLEPRSTQGNIKPHFAETGPIQNIFHTQVGKNPGLVCLCVGTPATKLLGKHVNERKKIILTQLMALYFPEQSETTIPAEEFLGMKAYIDKLWAEEEYSGGCYCGMWSPNGSFYKYGEKYLPRQGNNREKGSFSDCWEHHLLFASTELSDYFVAYMEGALRAGEITGGIVHENLA